MSEYAKSAKDEIGELVAGLNGRHRARLVNSQAAIAKLFCQIEDFEHVCSQPISVGTINLRYHGTGEVNATTRISLTIGATHV